MVRSEHLLGYFATGTGEESDIERIGIKLMMLCWSLLRHPSARTHPGERIQAANKVRLRTIESCLSAPAG